MNPQLIIDAIVRQTTVLIAQLSTAAGVRAPLSRVADQVFLDLAREIEAQGVSRKVAADMFGLALRTYQTKVQRLERSSTERDRTLWEGLLAYVEEHGPVSRRKLLEHFERDDPTSIGAVLNDLVQSGLVERVKARSGPAFRVTQLAERQSLPPSGEAVAALVWVAIYRGADTASAIEGQLGLDADEVTAALTSLKAQGRVSETAGRLAATGVVVPVGAEQGWEAAVFDHYQSMVTAITRKVTQGAPRSGSEDVVGGTTITFEVHRDHPLRDEVRGLLQRMRGEVNSRWQLVGEHNQRHPSPHVQLETVSFYFGQSTNDNDQGEP
jgi:DNA-binding MarR family transcriptional regulator